MLDLLTTEDRTRPEVASLSWLRDRARPSLQLASALDRVRRAPAILPAMRSVPDALRLTDMAVSDGADPSDLVAPILEAIDDDTDSLTALAAIHMLARIPGHRADAELAELILDGVPGYENHAIWAMADRPAAPALTRMLARAVARGGLQGMHAQRVLARWADTVEDPVLSALESALREHQSADARRYLVETIGLVPGRPARFGLECVALDASESMSVRVAAIAAFAERTAERLPTAVSRLAASHDELRHAVQTVRAQRHLSRRGPRRDGRRSTGLRVAQIHLAATLDPGASSAGVGDAGGVATMLSQLGVVLADQSRIAEVISIGRALPSETQYSSAATAGRRFERVPLAQGEGSGFSVGWPSVVAAARGIRASLLASYVPDVVHLRMADPGSLAGAMVARELGIPTVFTLAPDPHGPIQAAEAAGLLDRRGFASEDARDALWFRANLVEHLVRDAREVVLFPRPRLRVQLERLTGIDIGAGAPKHTLVAEGVDTARAGQAAQTVETATSTPRVLANLQRSISRLPAPRHGLPLVVSVGRLHKIKGMSRLVEAFAQDERLTERANLVIIGGDLERPSPGERTELARIESLVRRYPELEDRVVLLGHLPNDDVALIHAAAHAGWGKFIGSAGAYACGSDKEEFGLAIIEAMAAGLPVVAPRAGGPSTYVEEGVTGSLVDTTDTIALAGAMRAALELAVDPATADRLRSVVDDRFTLDRMARTLAAVYRTAAGASTLALPIGAIEDRVEAAA